MRKRFDPIITSDDILGKEAIDPEGEFLGVVMKLHIDRENKTLVGITVDQGFMKPDLFVGLEYISRFGVDAIFLNKIPFEKYIGLSVYFHDGVAFGTVSDLEESSGKIQSILVRIKDNDRPGPGILKRGRTARIPSRHLQEIGSSVILKKGYTPDQDMQD